MRLTEARQPALGPWPKGGSVAAETSHTAGFSCLFWDVGTGHRQRSLVGYKSKGSQELDTTY